MLIIINARGGIIKVNTISIGKYMIGAIEKVYKESTLYSETAGEQDQEIMDMLLRILKR